MKNIFLGVVVPYSILLPILIALFQFKRLDHAAKALLVYLLFSGALSVVIYYTARILHVNNLPAFHIGTLFEFIVLAEFYKRILPFKKIILYLQLLFFAACIINAVFFQSIYIFNSYTRSLEALIIMLFAVNYFAKLFTDTGNERISNLPSFWFNTGLFLYFSGANMLFIFSNYILQETKQNFLTVWNIHAGFVLLMYLLFTIGFIKCKK